MIIKYLSQLAPEAIRLDHLAGDREQECNSDLKNARQLGELAGVPESLGAQLL